MPYSEWNRYLKEFSPQNAMAPPPPGLYCATGTANAVEGWDAVGPAQLAEFAERGFIVVEKAFDESQLSDAVAAIGSLLSGASESYKPGAWGEKHGVLLRPGENLESVGVNQLDALVLARALVAHDSRLAAIARHPGLTRFLRQAMGDDPVLVHDMVRAKPESLGDKPWHQDLTHFNIHHSCTVVTAWIAIDDAPLEAGCLHFIAGSHRSGPVRHVYCRDYQIADDEVRREGQVAAPVAGGSCVLFNALIHHGSPPNRWSKRRLALQLTFKPSAARTISDEERIRAFAGGA